VSERKPRSGTILDFVLRILDSKKKTIPVRLIIQRRRSAMKKSCFFILSTFLMIFVFGPSMASEEPSHPEIDLIDYI